MCHLVHNCSFCANLCPYVYIIELQVQYTVFGVNESNNVNKNTLSSVFSCWPCLLLATWMVL